MPKNDDIYSLLAWCIDQQLKAHLNAAKHHGFTKGLEYAAEERMWARIIDKIQNGRVSQRPHVKDES